MSDLFESTDGLIKALKVSEGEAVMITIPTSPGFDHSNIDKLAFQVRRSWPGVPVLIVSGDVEVTVVEYPRVPAELVQGWDDVKEGRLIPGELRSEEE